jgi:hypothetical protein
MSQPTPIAVLKEAAERGLTLSINGQKLRVTPTNRLTPDFHETLRQHKWHLLTMLGKRSDLPLSLRSWLFFVKI